MKKVLLFVVTLLAITGIAGATTVDYPLPGLATPAVVILQSAATSGNGNEVDTKHALDNMVLEIIGSAGISAGAVQVEVASSCGYAGTWATLGTAVTVNASTMHLVQITAPVGCLRCRISTPISGGTVTVYFAGTKTGMR